MGEDCLHAGYETVPLVMPHQTREHRNAPLFIVILCCTMFAVIPEVLQRNDEANRTSQTLHSRPVKLLS